MLRSANGAEALRVRGARIAPVNSFKRDVAKTSKTEGLNVLSKSFHVSQERKGGRLFALWKISIELVESFERKATPLTKEEFLLYYSHFHGFICNFFIYI